MKQRQALGAVITRRYQVASRKEKKQMLDEFCETTGYNRCYARLVLRRQGQRVRIDNRRVFEGDVRQSQTRPKPKIYDAKVAKALVKIWVLLDYLCSKRLVAILPEIVERLEQFNELRLEPETRAKLLQMSAATADRILKPERSKYELRGRSRTRPGTCSNIRFRSAPSANGMNSGPALWSLIWWPTTAAWPWATTCKRLI